ncbi:MAG: hypothetical protein LC792_07785, partial [Actinobacteria bacterium]|nr:hypothetical protein [Actinomycetota bacterium]
MKRCILATVVTVLTLGFGAARAGAEASPAGVTTSTVGGAWAQVVNCLFTRYDPSNGNFTCVGSSTWEGAWT